MRSKHHTFSFMSGEMMASAYPKRVIYDHLGKYDPFQMVVNDRSETVF